MLYLLVAAFLNHSNASIEVAAYESFGECNEVAEYLNQHNEGIAFYCEELDQ